MKILLPVDGSQPGLHMLAVLGANPELLPARHAFVALTVVDPRHPGVSARSTAAAAVPSCEEEAQAVLAPVRRFARQHGWRLETRWAIGRPAQEIVRHAREGGFDLVVMGTHGRSAAAGLVLGSVSNHVLQHCDVAVLLVPWKEASWVMVSPGAFGTARTGEGREA